MSSDAPAGNVPGGDSGVAVLIVSCDAYGDLWPLFFECFFEQWPDCPYPVYLGANSRHYDSPKVRTILVGPDVDYSTNLMAMLRAVPCERVILWLDDRVPAERVDSARLRDYAEYARLCDAPYMKLIPNLPVADARLNNRDIGVFPKGTRYRISLTVALWKKETLALLLRAGENAWELERRGSHRARSLAGPFLGLTAAGRRRAAIREKHVVARGRVARDALGFVRAKGHGELIERRGKQGLLGYLYVKAYLAVWEAYFSLRGAVIGMARWRTGRSVDGAMDPKP